MNAKELRAALILVRSSIQNTPEKKGTPTSDYCPRCRLHRMRKQKDIDYRIEPQMPMNGHCFNKEDGLKLVNDSLAALDKEIGE